jgi:radical SAM superfamily enzyme YgiQ (UPF0313 family)
VRVVLISTYELGHAPFGLASPKAWLAADGHEVRTLDLAVEKFDDALIRDAGMVAFYLPMHTATRLALPLIERVKRANSAARIVAYGLYAPLNEDLLRAAGVEAMFGGEFEAALVRFARAEVGASNGIERLTFLTPDRNDSPKPDRYAKLRIGSESKSVAYTEASRGCKHLCRHCPVVPVYRGQFRVVGREVVLDDIRQQIANGATHVTFGDPDFFNGPTHAMRIVEALHDEFPGVTYDATIKIEHLLRHRDLLERLHETGCLFVTSAVESVDDAVLAKLEKNHTRADFREAAGLMRANGIAMQPTFIAFTPWTTIDGYRDLLRTLIELDLVENVGTVQLALRLLITSGSRLLELDEIRDRAQPFDSKSLVYPWVHEDAKVDRLGAQVFRAVASLQKQGLSRAEIFAEICEIAGMKLENFDLTPRAAIPYLDEPWYC